MKAFVDANSTPTLLRLLASTQIDTTASSRTGSASGAVRRGLRRVSAGRGHRRAQSRAQQLTEVAMCKRPALNQLGLSAGKKARLYRILYQHGLRNGTANVPALRPGARARPEGLLRQPAPATRGTSSVSPLEGGFNGIALQIGLARKFYWEYAGEVPLVLKLNGKTDIPRRGRPGLAGERHGGGSGTARRGRGGLHALRGHARAGT